MKSNRSIPASTVVPVLAYPNVREAATWLCDAFGFTVRVRIADHRVQLNVGDGAMVVAERRAGASGECAMRVLVRVGDVDSHHERARAHGAREVHAPADYPYGERQYTVTDIAGHEWTFSQTIADIAPEEWGGESGEF
ncbi:MAG: glyoxalase [Gemmatimonadota bacterium]|nr:glyoxalase [Gemmatimonadota bacterium]